MRSRLIAAAAFAVLAAVFVVDVLTPQTLVVAILLDVPIVLAALTQSRRLTASLVGSAIAADVVAAIANAARDGYHWHPIGVGDRLLSVTSIVLVGYLSTEVQERAERIGRLGAQEARARREAMLSAAADRIRASLSNDVVTRAIVREAAAALDAATVTWYPSRRGETLRAGGAAREVEVLAARPTPEIVSLMHRAAESGDVTVVRSTDPLGRFVLDSLHARSALAIPLGERGTEFGVLIAALPADEPDDLAVSTARTFASIAVSALAQARLFGELAERNEALSHRQDVIRDLVYAISHDLRTPLSALSLTLAQAADGAYGALPESYAGVLRDSRVSIDDLMRLAETLLLVARFESGEYEPVREPVDLVRVAAEVVSELQATAEARGIGLSIVSPTPTQTRGSRGDIKRAITNLTANALEHTPAGGTVTVEVGTSGGAARVRVVDDGFGLDEGLRARLFERFVTGSRTGGGTGLGLYIVRRIAEETGGSVRYEPRAPRGSVFTLTLPNVAA